MNVKNILIDKISPSLMNPRKTFDEAALEELAANIAKQGLLQPITVRPTSEAPYLDEESGEVINVDDTYEIVCGERRFRAFLKLKAMEDDKNIAGTKTGKKKTDAFQYIPCLVRNMTDDEAFEAMITENLQRKDVDPIEEAFAFAQLIEKGRRLEDIALKFGKSARFVFDRIKLNSLIPSLKQRVREGGIPLSGAMLLSKLDNEQQAKFDRNHQGQCVTNQVRRFMNDIFMELDRTDWVNDDIWPDDEFESCSDCECNTANHGCLFYEMNCEKARCINPVCFNNKKVAYVHRKIDEEQDNLVKCGTSLIFGKTVIISGGEEMYWSDATKEIYRKMLAVIRQKGYEIIDPIKVFDGKCFYAEDDERTQNMLADNTVYRCLSFFDNSSPQFKIKYYYVRKDKASESSAVAEPKQIEIENVLAKIKRAKELVIEKSAEEMRKWAQEKPYYKRSKELSLNEQTVYDVMVLRNCSDDFLKTLGLSKHKKESDFVNYVKNNSADRNRWHRAFIAKNLSDNEVNFYPYMQKCQTILFSEQYPDEYNAMAKKLADSYQKKESKLKEQLKNLENNIMEKA